LQSLKLILEVVFFILSPEIFLHPVNFLFSLVGTHPEKTTSVVLLKQGQSHKVTCLFPCNRMKYFFLFHN